MLKSIDIALKKKVESLIFGILIIKILNTYFALVIVPQLYFLQFFHNKLEYTTLFIRRLILNMEIQK